MIPEIYIFVAWNVAVRVNVIRTMTETVSAPSAQRLRVDIFSDIACPWCFIGKRRFEKGLQDSGLQDSVDVVWHAYQLDPSLPEKFEGDELEYLVKTKGMDPAQLEVMLKHVTEQAESEGLNYDFENLKVANSFTALRVLEFAKQQGMGNEMKEALLSAHFEQGLNTGDKQTLLQLTEKLGLDAVQLEADLAAGKYTDEVNNDIAQARQIGVTGVPFFILQGKYGISGAQPAELFANALSQVHAEINA